MNKKVRNFVDWVLLILSVIWGFFPILYIIIRSFTPPKNIFNYPPTILSFSFENYQRLLNDWPQYWHSLNNSLIITLLATIFTLILSFPASYALSRYKGRELTLFAFFLIIIRLFPPIIITIPLFPILKTMNLGDSHVILIILYASFMVSLTILIIKSFIDQIPVELEEAAFIDGCNRFQAFIKIILPLLGPGLAATAIIVAIFSWNEFLFALLFTMTKARTAPVMLSEMIGSFLGADWGALFAATTIQFLPILIFTWLVQRYLVQGLTMGGIKG